MTNFIQYDIWLVNLDPTIGAEIKKTRPCIILNNDEIGALPLKIIAPITVFKPNYADNPWMVTVKPNSRNGLNKKSTIDMFQLRSLSEIRMMKRIGTIEDSYISSIRNAINSVF